MQVLAITVSAVSAVIALSSLVASLVIGRRQYQLSRQANALPVTIGFFDQHRREDLTRARRFVNSEAFLTYDPADGLDGLPDDGSRQLVQELMWYYDHLGTFVMHDFLDSDIVNGYLGGSVIACWERLSPFVRTEREKRHADGARYGRRYQINFETLYKMCKRAPVRKPFVRDDGLAELVVDESDRNSA